MPSPQRKIPVEMLKMAKNAKNAIRGGPKGSTRNERDRILDEEAGGGSNHRWGQETLGENSEDEEDDELDLDSASRIAQRRKLLLGIVVGVLLIAFIVGFTCEGGRCASNPNDDVGMAMPPEDNGSVLAQEKSATSPAATPTPSLAASPTPPPQTATSVVADLQAQRASENAVTMFLDPELTYTVIKTYHHDQTAFTQGLELIPGTSTFLESTGRYGFSTIRKVDIATGDVLADKSVDRWYFAEGCTIVGDTVYQITWREKVCLTYDLATLNPKQQFSYTGEGWGLTHNEEGEIIMSDGSSKIVFRDPGTFAVKRTIRTAKLTQINELEYVRGEIWANIWHSDKIARIRPADGELLGWIDLTRINPSFNPSRYSDDVLNGIAWDSVNDKLWVTGKLWSQMYEIDLKIK